MKLKQFLEMTLPMVNNVQQATTQIQSAYDTAVVKKQPNADVKGGVEEALRWLQMQPNVAQYQDLVRKGTATLKAINTNRGTLSQAQAQNTNVKTGPFGR
jgi:hypothetical protein